MDSQPFNNFGDTGTSFLQDLNNEDPESLPVFSGNQPLGQVPTQNTTMDYRGFPSGQPNIPAPYGTLHPHPSGDSRSQQMPAYYNSSQQQQPYYQQYPMGKATPSGHHDPATYSHSGAKPQNQSPWPHYPSQQQMPSYGQQNPDPMWTSQSVYPPGSYLQQQHQMPPSRYGIQAQTPGLASSSLPTHSVANKPICHTGVNYPMQMRMPVTSVQSQQPYQAPSQGYMQHQSYGMTQQGNANSQPNQQLNAIVPPMPYSSQENQIPNQHNKIPSMPHGACHSPGIPQRQYTSNQSIPNYSHPPLSHDLDPLTKQICTLEDRLRHLYQSRGQSPGIHQEMMEIQEQLRTMKTTRETEHLMKQRNRMSDLPQTQSSPSAQIASPQNNMPHIPASIAATAPPAMHQFSQGRNIILPDTSITNPVHAYQKVLCQNSVRSAPVQPVVVDVPTPVSIEAAPPALTPEGKVYSKVNSSSAENITPPKLTVADEEGFSTEVVKSDNLTTPPNSGSVDVKETISINSEVPSITSTKQLADTVHLDKPIEQPHQVTGNDSSGTNDLSHLTVPVSIQPSMICSPHTTDHISPPKMPAMTRSPVPSSSVSPSKPTEMSPHYGPRYPPPHNFHPHSQPGYYGQPSLHTSYGPSYGSGMPTHLRMPCHPSQSQVPGQPSGQLMYSGQGQSQMMLPGQQHTRHYQSIAPSPHAPYSGVGNVPRMPVYPPILPKDQQQMAGDYYLGPPGSSYQQPPQQGPPPHMPGSGQVNTPPLHSASVSPNKLPGEPAMQDGDATEPKPKKKRQYKRRKLPEIAKKDAKEADAEVDKLSPVKDETSTSTPVADSAVAVSAEETVPVKKKRAPPKKRQPSKKKAKVDETVNSASIDATLNESIADTSAITILATDAADGDLDLTICVDTVPDESVVVAAPPAKKKKIIKPKPKLKKRKPLPTLIKKKRKSRRGFDSDSDPENCMTTSKGGSADATKDKAEAIATTSSTAKRRSERVTYRKKYSEVDMGIFSDEDGEFAKEEDDIATMQETRMEDDTEVSTRVVEKILSHRTAKRTVQRTREVEDGKPVTEDDVEEEEEDVEEYYIKWKGYSYLHCEWKCSDEIDDIRMHLKIKRYFTKQVKEKNEDDEEEDLFNPDYVEVDRVLDVKVFRNDVEVVQEKKKSIKGKEDEQNEEESEKEIEKSPVLIEGKSIDTKEKVPKNTEIEGFEASEDKSLEAEIEVQNVDESLNPVDNDVSHITTVKVTEKYIPANECSPLEFAVKDNDESDAPLTASNVNKNSDSESHSEDVQLAVANVSEHDLEEASAESRTDKEVNDIAASKSNIDNKSDEIPPTESDEILPTESDEIPPTESAMKNELGKSVQESSDLNDTIKDAVNVSQSDKTSEAHLDDEKKETIVQIERSPSPVEVTYYLVKWRTLPYEDATWELAQDVDPNKVKEYFRWKEAPTVESRQIERPSKAEWQKLADHKPYKNSNRLRDYQLEGINWLTFCYFNHRNCILADEMGLGKTVQSITFLIEVFAYGVQGPFLIIVPLSTVGNWQREFENWSDLNVIVYHGSSTSRSMLQEYEMFYKDSKGQRLKDVYKFHALITTYEILMTDIEFIGQFDWRIAIIDEAHRLKNKKCKLGEGLRYLELEHRVLLTGTPLQNNVEELFCLLNFLEPRKFPSPDTFLAEFGDLKTEEQVDNLKSILKPMMLRRLKEDVEKSLAPKEETIIEVELTNIQKKYYRAIMERNFAFLSKGATSSANVPNLMNTMMELRKCCNHPFLIKGAEDNILSELRQQPPKEDYAVEEQLQFNALVNASGKLVLVHKLLPKLKSGGHKVLVFSQMIRVLDILEDYLIHQRYSYERIDGRIHGMLRQEAIDRFCNDSSKFVFLLCTKAGGLGINLTAADVVIIYDSDWNPQNDLQAQARCHRIGQLKMVNVYRLITRNTYEREMFDRASLKLGLDKAVLQSMGSKEARQAQLSKKEIEDLLKKGAYAAVMDDDNAGEDFCEEDIDKILQSRSTVVQLEQGEKNSTFSKATFSMTDNRNDIDVDDPNFWAKWAKKVGFEENPLENDSLIMDEPRQRRQTSRYSTAQTNPYNLSDLEESSRSSDDDDGGAGGSSGVGGKRRKTAGGASSRKTRRSQREGVAGEPWDRSDLFKAEKCMLLWGWGRWRESVSRVAFKRLLPPEELETVSRAMLIYALRHYKGDDRIRGFICDLVRPDSDQAAMRRHKGLSAPVARGRRGRRLRARPGEEDPPPEEVERVPGVDHAAQEAAIDWDLDPVAVLSCDSFLRHLERAANKLLHRVQTLYFLHHEVVGSPRAAALLSGRDHSEILPSLASILRVLPLLAPADLPVYWWDSVADSCLLMGIFKHGFEKYSAVRADPKFCFLAKCGPPQGSVTVWEDADLIELEEDSMSAIGPHSCQESNNPIRKTECSLMDGKNYNQDSKSPEENSESIDKAGTKQESVTNGLQLSNGVTEDSTDVKHAPSHTKINGECSPGEDFSSNGKVVVNGLKEEESESQDTKTDVVGKVENREENEVKTIPEVVDGSVESKEEVDTKSVPMAVDGIVENKEDDVDTKSVPMAVDNIVENKEDDVDTKSVSMAVDDIVENKEDDVETKSVSMAVDNTTEKKEEEEDTKSLPEVVDNAVESKGEEGGTKSVHMAVVSTAEKKEEKEDTKSVPEVVDSAVESKGEEEDTKSVSMAVDESTENVKSEVERLISETDRELTAKDSSPIKTEINETKDVKVMDITDTNQVSEVKSEEDTKQLLPFPSMTDLNGRFRKLIGYFQRLKHQEEFNSERYQKMVATQMGPVLPEPVVRPDPNWIDVKQLRWSRREAADFYRVISSFGVEYDRTNREYSWERFRSLANITRKTDQALTEYFRAFYSMCRAVCKREPFEDDLPPSQIQVDPISEERANRCLAKIDLLSRIRSEVLPHPKLDQHLELCQRSSDFPDWWMPGKHDKDLLLGVAKHGLTRTDYNVLTDEELCFQDIVSLIQQRIRQDPQLSRQMASGGGVGAVAAAAVTALTSAATSAADAAGTNEGEVPSCDKSDTLTVAVGDEGDKTAPNREDNKTQSKEDNASASGPASATRGASAKESPQATSITIMGGGIVGAGPPDQAEWSLRFATSIAVGWPKDRTVQHRLEAVCQCVETGQWPTPRRFLVPGGGIPSATLDTAVWPPHVAPPPAGTSSPPPPSSSSKTTGGRTRGRKRHSLHDNMAAFRRLTGQSDDTESMASTDTDTRTTTTPIREGGSSTPLPPLPTISLEASPGTSGLPSRKRKIDNLADRLMNAAAAENKKEKLDQSVNDPSVPSVPSSPGAPVVGGTKPRTTPTTAATAASGDSAAAAEDPWLVRVPVINLRDGSLVYGDEAPLRRDLENWLDERPDFMPYSVEKEDQEIYGRLAKSRGQDTSAMEALAYSHYLSMLQASNQSYASLMPNMGTGVVGTAGGQVQTPPTSVSTTAAAYAAYSGGASTSSSSAAAIFGKEKSSSKSPVTSSPKLETSLPPTTKRKESSSGVGRGRGRKPGSTNRPRVPSTDPSSAAAAMAASMDPAASMEAMMAAYQAYMYNPLVYSQLLAAQTGYSSYLAAAAASQQQQQHLFNGGAADDSNIPVSASSSTPLGKGGDSKKLGTSVPSSSRQQHSRDAKTASALAVAASGSNPRKSLSSIGGSSSSSSSLKQQLQAGGCSSSDPVAATRDILLKDYKALASSSDGGALNLTSSTAPLSDDNEDDMVLDLSKK